ncbi:MAG: N-acetylmuramoyl-L-alanine amidase [Tranquillimonas sp.]|jgi:N-acetylmuramoyl-L-alanine amidase
MLLGPGAVPAGGPLIAAAWHPSPNHGPRREGARPDLIVLHYTAMADARAALDWLSAPESGVSAHYLLAEDGALWQLVDEERRAWHAGAGRWGAVTDVNSRSVGIELANDGASPFPEPQMLGLEALLDGLSRRWRIRPERVIGHSDMAPGRKIDPGPRFDWRRLALGGRSIWPGDVSSAPVTGGRDTLLPLLRRIGYTADVAPETLLGAFRLRFRPWATGPVTSADIAVAGDLARRFPVDPPTPVA